MKNPKLSIIMPLYNVAQTIELALDSILMQDVNFDYEILAVDDASTDNTIEILEKYAKQYKQIKIIRHKENQGNAIAFYNALCASCGDYFCVLDGDDYYTVKNKLQKQVDFLDNDKYYKYTAVSHKYLRVNTDCNIFDDPQLFNGEQDWSYLDFVRCGFYSHTSTYMYRNLFRGKVPEKMKEPLYRGDNPRTFLHMLYSKGRIKQLNFVGSVYFYNGAGIWSQVSAQAQFDRNMAMFEELGSNFSSEIEKQIWNKVIEYRKSVYNPNLVKKQTFFSPEYFLCKIYSLASKYGFKHKDFIFQQVYKSEFIDSFCESIGFVEMVKRGFRPSKALKTKSKRILITVSKLTSTGGGVYNEIKDIINMYPKHNVYILWTDLDSEQDLDIDVKKQLSEFKNLTCIYGQSSIPNKISYLCDKIIAVAPSKIYHYCGHNNVYLDCMIQSMLSKNICVFSFDHGFSLGLDNTSYDVYITKRPMDYEILSKEYGDKVIYMPCWNKDKVDSNKYKPFDEHIKLITACAAARYYKLSSDKKDNYIDVIAQLLQKTGGKHIHYGPIPDEEIVKIKSKLKEYGVDEQNFVNIPWAEDLPKSMYENHIDVFIEPFPTVSYKITLDVLSAGIPVISHKSYLRMGITDFIYPNHLEWSNVNEFIDILSNITKQDLQKHSELSRKYYEENHHPDVLFKCFITETGLDTPREIPFYDNRLIDIDLVSTLIDKDLEEPKPVVVQPVQTNEPPKTEEKQPSNKFVRFIKHLAIKKRCKEIFYGILLVFAQIPVLDLLIRSKTRQKLLNKILKHYR